ncbi:hypothetical protein EDB85DRAFT_540416 [Lactarius pseudohatsudake]|nr:hypothetical protein EDB85DRAFT_540416 [Lactarius pseudohatsudake]
MSGRHLEQGLSTVLSRCSFFGGVRVGMMETAFQYKVSVSFSCRFSFSTQSTSVATMHTRVPRLSRVLSPRRVPITTWRRSATAGPSVATPLAVEFIDIFDAPHQLGGSSTIIGFSSPRMIDSSTRQETPPLPEPILYDGPSRGRKSRSLSTCAEVLSTSLPPPVVFDGPARRRPYLRPNAPLNSRLRSLTLMPQWVMEKISLLNEVGPSKTQA